VVRLILFSLIQLIVSTSKGATAWPHNPADPSWINFFDLLRVVEIFLFFRPIPLSAKFGVHITGETKCCPDEKSVLPLLASFLFFVCFSHLCFSFHFCCPSLCFYQVGSAGPGSDQPSERRRQQREQ
jgi:hypothetical protein